MTIKPVKRPLNTQDAQYFEDLIYFLRKIGGLKYEYNPKTEQRIQSRIAEREELQVIIEGEDPNETEKMNQFESVFMLHFSAYVTEILVINNVPSEDICNPAKGVNLLKNYPETFKQVIAELEEKVKALKASTPKLELVPKKNTRP